MRTPVIPVLCFAISILSATPLAGQSCRSPTAIEQTAIQELSQKDKTASIAGDWQMLATLWTDDAVALPPGEHPIVGIQAIRTWLERDRIDLARLDVSDYRIDVNSTTVCGDTAVQWGTTSIAVRPKGSPAAVRAEGNIERILSRQNDGSWKVQRAIWNIGKPLPDKAGPAK